MNDLSDQTVMVFDDATARATAIPTPVEGMVTYLEDVGGAQGLEVFDGAVFTPVAIEPDPPAILQVVQTIKTDSFSTASTAYTPVTGLTASITPSSASNKVLVTAQFQLSLTRSAGNDGGHARLTGGNAGTYIGDAAGSRERAVATHHSGGPSGTTIVFLDSPATTSPVTYGLELRKVLGVIIAIGQQSQDIDNANFGRVPSSITLMEVAG